MIIPFIKFESDGRPRSVESFFRSLLLTAFLLAMLGLSGCGEVYYYWQAGWGQMDIIQRRKPIKQVIADEKTDPETRRKLELILKVQDFGTSRIALPKEGQFYYYADIGRNAVTWLVLAAPEFSLKEKAFCYPIVGCLGYRGYFKKADAEDYAEALRVDEGLDVVVRPVSAYSTLGWFDDPVLNTFLREGDTQMVATLFHEQAHGVYFLKGDTAFNESFASFVEESALRAYLAEGDQNQVNLARWEAAQEDRKRYRNLVLAGRNRLEALYDRGGDPDAMRLEKARLFDQLRQDYQKARESFKILNYDRWFAQPLNNAHLAGFSQYETYVNAFRALFEEAGRDYGRFFEAVKALGELPPEERKARLSQLEKRFVATNHNPKHP